MFLAFNLYLILNTFYMYFALLKFSVKFFIFNDIINSIPSFTYI